MSDGALRALERRYQADPKDEAVRRRYEDALVRAGRGVFLVWAGEYSDARVIAAYTDRADADTWLAQTACATSLSEHRVYGAPSRVVFQSLNGHLGPDAKGGWEVEIDREGKVDHVDWQSWQGLNERALRMGKNFVGYGRTVEHARRSAEELRRVTLVAEGGA